MLETVLLNPILADFQITFFCFRLASYVYEYLVHSNAPKAAEAFKNEVLVQQGNPNPVPAEPPGFLVNWFR